MRFERDRDSRRSADPVVASTASHSGPDRRSRTEHRVRNETSDAGSRDSSSNWR
jgi:hypothetical protein